MFEKRLVQGDKTSGPGSWRALALVVSAFLFVFPLIASSDPDSVLAIKGGTILTMAGEPLRGGTILVHNGKIAEIGNQVEIPKGAQIVDASGKYVIPGIIDAMTYYGIRPPDRNDVSNPVTPENRAIQAFYPFSDFLEEGGGSRNKELLIGGITSIYIAPGNRQVIGGQGAVVKTFGKYPDEMILLEPASVDMTLGDPVKSPFGEMKKSPSTRMSIAALIRKTLVSGREYLERLEASSKPPRNPGMEAMARILRKELPARVEADLPDDIRTAIRIAEEFHINIIIDGGGGAYKIKELLAEKKMPVVLGPISHLSISGQPVNESPELGTLRNEENAAQLANAGVKIAMASFGYDTGYTGGPFQGRWLLLEAALATGFGLSENEALKAVTINAAEILGVADRVGSLEKGKDADIVILDGPPLNVKTRVEQVYVNGKLAYD